jgi:hypothetical protein
MQKFAHKVLFLTTFVFIFGCTATFAQQAISPEKQALVKEFMEAMGGQKTATELIDTMVKFQEQEAPKMISSLIEADENLTAAQKDQLRQSITESTERVNKQTRDFFARINIGQMIEEISYPIYDKNFTESELRDLIAFYRTPTGQKMVSVGPKLVMEAMVAFSEKFAPKMQEFLKRSTEAELNLLKEKLKETRAKRANLKS